MQLGEVAVLQNHQSNVTLLEKHVSALPEPNQNGFIVKQRAQKPLIRSLLLYLTQNREPPKDQIRATL